MKGKLIIGIDVSKSTLDYVEVKPRISLSELTGCPVSQIKNDIESIMLFLSNYAVDKSFFVLEPTGSYSDKLQSILVEHGYAFALVNPRQSSHFCKFLGITSKHDVQAARTLAYMGATQHLPPYQRPRNQTKQRKKLLSAINGLLKTQRAMTNRVHAMEQYKAPCMIALEAFEKVIQRIEQEIKGLQNALAELNSDAHFSTQKSLAMSIKGVGPVTAEWVLISTDGLQHFHTPGQLVKFCGLAPQSHRSGTSVHSRGGMTKQACAKIRAALFMGAKAAIRWNKACKDLYERLRAKGKSYYKAMVAVMAKLLKQIFGVIKSGKEFDNEYYLQFQKK